MYHSIKWLNAVVILRMDWVRIQWRRLWWAQDVDLSPVGRLGLCLWCRAVSLLMLCEPVAAGAFDVHEVGVGMRDKPLQLVLSLLLVVEGMEQILGQRHLDFSETFQGSWVWLCGRSSLSVTRYTKPHKTLFSLMSHRKHGLMQHRQWSPRPGNYKVSELAW